MSELECIQTSSQYLAILLRTHPEFTEWLLPGKNLYRRYPLTELYKDLRRTVRDAQSFDGALQLFRGFKQRHFLRIGGRDLLGLADLTETTSQISDLAGVALQVGLDLLSGRPEWWAEEGDAKLWPKRKDKIDLAVMGLGKLGGQELNYVSDVDLIFLNNCPGKPDESVIEAMELLNRLCHWLMRLLSDRVNGDRVFQVDLRLRPMGKDGMLIPSAAAAAEHYLLAGRPWERQMLLKARPVAGTRSLGAEFMKEVRPFVFRRFLDFQALDELRSMRDKIATEAVRLGLTEQRFNVKLGVGGIREVEFLVQSLQLIYGGRHPELDEPNTLRCLERLRELNLLSPQVAQDLRECYIFLRKVEHWVQLDQNRQTQKIPQSEDSRLRLASALGFEGDEKRFSKRLEDCCAQVHRCFLELFHGDGDTVKSGIQYEESDEDRAEDESPPENLPEESLSLLNDRMKVFPSFVRQAVTDTVKGLARLENREIPEKALLRLERYFAQVIRRPGLVKVFGTSSPWIGDLAGAIAKSEMIADLLAHHPSLAEGIATCSGACPAVMDWEASSAKLLDRANDYEGGLEWIRRLKNERVLQFTLADLRGEMDYETIESGLSDLADFVVKHTYERVRENLKLDSDLPLSVLALGKLGSREMSYLSDLDLVFVYEPGPGDAVDHTPGDVIRLIQRVMRMLSTPLHEGPGYSVDARLRPTGSYGPLIVTYGAWLDYYSREADLWEIQALLRLRSVAGMEDLGRRIEEKAAEFCYRPRDAEKVWGRLCHLRRRMERERSEEGADYIDLKLGPGGLADLEFLAQGNQMIHGHSEASMRKRSVRAALASVLKCIPDFDGDPDDLNTAFTSLRALDHRVRLLSNQSSGRLNPERFEWLTAVGLWPPARDGGLIETWHDTLRFRRIVRASLQQFCPGL